MTDLKETAAQVAALIPRYSWELMDEEQRDNLMEKVVLPRYMKETKDGVKLGPTWWAEMVGASEPAIRNRVIRLQASQKSAEGERSPSHWTEAPSRIRDTRSVLTKAEPEQIEELIEALPAEAKKKVVRAASKVQSRDWDERMARSKAMQREAIGPEISDELDQQQTWRDAEGEVWRAVRAARDMLRTLSNTDFNDLPDSWRDEFIKAIDYVAADVTTARSVMTGVQDDDLDRLLAER